jgi:hypothetical protein
MTACRERTAGLIQVGPAGLLSFVAFMLDLLVGEQLNAERPIGGGWTDVCGVSGRDVVNLSERRMSRLRSSSLKQSAFGKTHRGGSSNDEMIKCLDVNERQRLLQCLRE